VAGKRRRDRRRYVGRTLPSSIPFFCSAPYGAFFRPGHLVVQPARAEAVKAGRLRPPAGLGLYRREHAGTLTVPERASGRRPHKQKNVSRRLSFARSARGNDRHPDGRRREAAPSREAR
jgi:hypothetical protein